MKFTIRRESVLLAGAAPIRIAHLSDLHLWFSAAKLQQLKPILTDFNPDLIALTGDYADTPIGRRLFEHWLEEIATCHPTAWIAGNHDHWLGGGFLRSVQGIAAAHSLDRKDLRLASGLLVTSGSRWGREGTPEESSVVLVHDPATLLLTKKQISQRQFPALILAGHLHGGQLNLWHRASGSPIPASWVYPWCRPRWDLGRTTVIVSSGLGDTLPLRIQAPKEIVLIETRPAAFSDPHESAN